MQDLQHQRSGSVCGDYMRTFCKKSERLLVGMLGAFEISHCYGDY